MTFDSKMEDFHHKTRLVTRRHMTDIPNMIMYGSVKSRYFVPNVFSVTVLDSLKVMDAKIMNACTTAPSEKSYGPKFGQDK